MADSEWKKQARLDLATLPEELASYLSLYDVCDDEACSENADANFADGFLNYDELELADLTAVNIGLGPLGYQLKSDSASRLFSILPIASAEETKTQPKTQTRIPDHLDFKQDDFSGLPLPVWKILEGGNHADLKNWDGAYDSFAETAANELGTSHDGIFRVVASDLSQKGPTRSELLRALIAKRFEYDRNLYLLFFPILESVAAQISQKFGFEYQPASGREVPKFEFIVPESCVIEILQSKEGKTKSVPAYEKTLDRVVAAKLSHEILQSAVEENQWLQTEGGGRALQVSISRGEFGLAQMVETLCDFDALPTDEYGHRIYPDILYFLESPTTSLSFQTTEITGADLRREFEDSSRMLTPAEFDALTMTALAGLMVIAVMARGARDQAGAQAMSESFASRASSAAAPKSMATMVDPFTGARTSSADYLAVRPTAAPAVKIPPSSPPTSWVPVNSGPQSDTMSFGEAQLSQTPRPIVMIPQAVPQTSSSPSTMPNDWVGAPLYEYGVGSSLWRQPLRLTQTEPSEPMSLPSVISEPISLPGTFSDFRIADQNPVTDAFDLPAGEVIVPLQDPETHEEMDLARRKPKLPSEIEQRNTTLAGLRDAILNNDFRLPLYTAAHEADLLDRLQDLHNGNLSRAGYQGIDVLLDLYHARDVDPEDWEDYYDDGKLGTVSLRVSRSDRRDVALVPVGHDLFQQVAGFADVEDFGSGVLILPNWDQRQSGPVMIIDRDAAAGQLFSPQENPYLIFPDFEVSLRPVDPSHDDWIDVSDHFTAAVTSLELDPKANWPLNIENIDFLIGKINRRMARINGPSAPKAKVSLVDDEGALSLDRFRDVREAQDKQSLYGKLFKSRVEVLEKLKTAKAVGNLFWGPADADQVSMPVLSVPDDIYPSLTASIQNVGWRSSARPEDDPERNWPFFMRVDDPVGTNFNAILVPASVGRELFYHIDNESNEPTTLRWQNRPTVSFFPEPEPE